MKIYNVGLIPITSTNLNIILHRFSVIYNMRKNVKKYIKLKCKKCKIDFDKELREYNRCTKRGQIDFYCSYPCSRIGTGITQRDEFTIFRTFYFNCKHTAEQRGLDFNLDLEFLKNLWDKQDGKCAYTNINMDIAETYRHKNHSIMAASVDRIDSNKGYLKDNVEFVCRFVNLGKRDYSKEDVIKIINLIKDNGRMPERQSGQTVNLLS
jgi:hypothetical protein